MIEKDYLDELIESNLERDPRFAAERPSVEAALSLAALRHKAGLTQQEAADRMGVARPRGAEIERDPGRVSFARVSTSSFPEPWSLDS